MTTMIAVAHGVITALIMIVVTAVIMGGGDIIALIAMTIGTTSGVIGMIALIATTTVGARPTFANSCELPG